MAMKGYTRRPCLVSATALSCRPQPISRSRLRPRSATSFPVSCPEPLRSSRNNRALTVFRRPHRTCRLGYRSLTPAAADAAAGRDCLATGPKLRSVGFTAASGAIPCAYGDNAICNNGNGGTVYDNRQQRQYRGNTDAEQAGGYRDYRQYKGPFDSQAPLPPGSVGGGLCLPEMSALTAAMSTSRSKLAGPHCLT